VLFQLLANLVGDTKTGFGQNYPHKIAFLNRTGRKIGTDSQIDNVSMQDEVGRMFTGLMLRQKSIRYAHPDDNCPECGAPTVFLNIERNHYEVCHACKKYLHFGENLHSAWRDETPEVWAANQKTLAGYTEFKSPYREIQNREIPNRKLLNVEQNRIMDMAHLARAHGDAVNWDDVAEDILAEADAPVKAYIPKAPWLK
jgi:hypothetical protein